MKDISYVIVISSFLNRYQIIIISSAFVVFQLLTSTQNTVEITLHLIFS